MSKFIGAAAGLPHLSMLSVSQTFKGSLPHEGVYAGFSGSPAENSQFPGVDSLPNLTTCHSVMCSITCVWQQG